MKKYFIFYVFLCLPLFVSAKTEPVDSNTLHNKIMCGYQGWFTAAGDENELDRWIHWARNHESPNGTNLLVEMYPDLSEFSDDELFATDMTMNGTNAYLYSGRTYKTINRHVKWMKEYGIDGIFAQRFVVALYQGIDYVNHIKTVSRNLLKSCEEHGRVFAVMYDVSGATEDKFWKTIQADWIDMVDKGMMNNLRYLKHNGKPVVAIWGFGFKDGVHPPTNPAVAQAIIDWFKTNAPPKYRATVLGGIPGFWRTLNGDSRTDPAWADVYRSFDIISPWSVGRYGNQAGADDWKKTKIVPDLKETHKAGIDYFPVIWPGFSWKNLTGNKPNQIPRDGGKFYWRQAYNAVSAGADMIYVAMFDEVDEATAIYKTAPTAAETPDQGFWLTLDADGYSLPSDWYLRLTCEAGKMLRHDIPVTQTIPTDPGSHYASTNILYGITNIPKLININGMSTNAQKDILPGRQIRDRLKR